MSSIGSSFGNTFFPLFILRGLPLDSHWIPTPSTLARLIPAPRRPGPFMDHDRVVIYLRQICTESSSARIQGPEILKLSYQISFIDRPGSIYSKSSIGDPTRTVLLTAPCLGGWSIGLMKSHVESSPVLLISFCRILRRVPPQVVSSFAAGSAECPPAYFDHCGKSLLFLRAFPSPASQCFISMSIFSPSIQIANHK